MSGFTVHKIKFTVKAGVLSYVLVISIISAMVCASLIMLGYYYRISFIDYTQSDLLFSNAESGINYLLANEENIPEGKAIKLDLSESTETVVKKDQWGIFTVGSSHASSGRQRTTKIGYIGSDIEALPCLYLADHGDPLYLVGDTRISGTAYLPGGNARQGFLNNTSFTGMELVNGLTHKSAKELPSVRQDLVSHIQFMQENFMDHVAEGEMEGRVNSFKNAPLVFYSPSSMVINETMKGKILIISEESISLSGLSKLEDVILMAPYVEIKNGFEGTVQIFATDSIKMNSQASLLYPSALVLNSSSKGVISIETNTVVEGAVLAVGNGSPRERILKMGHNTFIDGSIYVQGNVQFSGRISGSLICENIVLQTPSAIHKNYLQHARIENIARAFSMYVPDFTALEASKGIMKWLE
ncbi:hypothetical protein LVD17_19055 [Fulvivirga ulvae]|uniref:hypothetical protein n=1 Tax=Fulvivirga ulvae TaxID=2904245 RepID=UPI001F456E73|nr:hypothetical protein [Fulvivirga ulvae]UII30393.1 hypothetical protein LVD17_19055 [Fulvivirga ulvae]